ncbi:type I site-specific deoxyribonuclease [Lacticaseibacillus zeae DSM 20178 = KCTC 3804]|uniref:site-specific DNA-methyltransferase (adenine-specific) n=2 Tax=Lacticaseibacillus zeae TaxID=57037 RepID=A0A5R8LQK4_LACZE|nr:N-6 DNA methylase [Lacticaseibacillus zeae]KRK12258.1 type I site-specific deoxyribonuclease [Lacticaseibacillus zeae DSM 20178 = KCTC 3804]OLS09584.1 restriction endonuclease [Lacticaseibacillus casei]QVI31099.1 N-6 DNA methylase [Lacticaseibacillus zeae]TLF39502.1 restriction endonuclease [Lacticaseibacillus zeae]
MSDSKNANVIEQRIWDTGNKYRGQFELESIITIWLDMIYLYTIKKEYAVLLEVDTVDLASLIKRLHDLAKTDKIQLAVVNDFDERVRHALLPRTNDENRLQVFNGIREDGIRLIREQCDRVSLMKILQQINIEFDPRMNGSHATPDSVNILMARIAGTQFSVSPHVTVYDPTAGIGGSLIAMRQVLDKSTKVKLVGQELNTQAYVRCSMMLDLTDNHATRHILANGDVLNQVGYSGGPKADIVITDPPYSVEWSPSDGLLESVPYSKIGVLPPKSKADFAFVLQGFSHLSEDGIMVIQLPHGILFRGGAEAKIRQYLLEQNYIDAVVGLSASLQYKTSVPTMLLVLRKNRMRKDVLFIDASDEVEKARRNNVIPESSIDTIVKTYENFRDVERYAHAATQDEILKNDFNLNIPRYVNKYIPPEIIPVSKLEERLADLKHESKKLDARAQRIMAKYRAE